MVSGWGKDLILQTLKQVFEQGKKPFIHLGAAGLNDIPPA